MIMNDFKTIPDKADHGKNIIELRGVSFSYGEVEALRDVDFAIHQGDYIGLIGNNGSGKTTLLKIMLGLLTPMAGSVRLFGQDIGDFKEWKKVGYVPQKATNFDPKFPATVKEIVGMGRYHKLLERDAARDGAAVRKALEETGMWAQRNRLIGDLSGGQQQRVFIARALVNDPEIIFLDEPTTGIDTSAQDEFYNLLQMLNRELGITLVLVSHDIRRVAEEVMHIACVNRTLTCHMTPEEYLEESDTAEIRGRNYKVLAQHDHNHNHNHR